MFFFLSLGSRENNNAFCKLVLTDWLSGMIRTNKWFFWKFKTCCVLKMTQNKSQCRPFNADNYSNVYFDQLDTLTSCKKKKPERENST